MSSAKQMASQTGSGLRLFPPHDVVSRSHKQDITPELFSPFSSRERDLVANQPDRTTLEQAVLDAHRLPSPEEKGDQTSSVPDILQQVETDRIRRIRGIPKRAFKGSLAPSAHSSSPSWKAVAPQFVQEHRLVNSSLSALHQQQTEDALLTPITHAQGNRASSHELTQQLDQLQLSPQIEDARPVATPRPGSHSERSDDVAQETAGQFRFPSLPTKLTDDSFHYRLRAAQFILLCSQQTGSDRLPSSGRYLTPNDSRAPLRTSRPTSRATPLPLHASKDTGCTSDGDDDDENISYYYTGGRNGSDDESEYLNFEACRSAHLGNKKKRKSSRFSSPPNVPAGASIEASEDGPHSASALPTASLPADNRGQGQVLVDRTNTLSQPPSTGLKAPQQHTKSQTEIHVPIHLTARSTPESLRLPKRQPGRERERKILRNRVCIRLAATFRKRRQERAEAEARAKREQQATRAEHDLRPKVDVESPSPASPERKLPPKRVNKAGKRAQAIRGGNSSVKPLTIAEIKARAAAASGTTLDSVGPSAKADRTPSPARAIEAPEQRSSPQPAKGQNAASVLRDTPSPHRKVNGDSHARATQKPVSASEEKGVKSTVAIPTSAFDFRMSSAITLRLRELRSQLDAASRNISTTAKAGDPHAVAQALSEAVAAPPLPPTRPVDAYKSATNRVAARGGDGLHSPSDVPPWVRHALEFQDSLKQQQPQPQHMATPKLRSPVQPTPRPPSSPMPPPPAPARARSGSSTPAHSAPHGSPAAQKPSSAPSSAKTTRANAGTNGRRKPASTWAHKHGSACKHGNVRQPGTGSALFTDDDWICIFCEYELYYGEAPLMLRACRNRKKQVEKKAKAKAKLQTALQKKSSAKSGDVGVAGGCQHHHDHGHDHHDHHGAGCEHDPDHDHGCHHDHGSTCGSDDYYHDHHHGHYDHGHGVHHHGSGKQHHSHHHDGDDDDAHRDRCDCGNSIHSSDFGSEDHH